MLPFRDKTRSNKWFYSYMLNKDVCKRPLKEYIMALQNAGVQTRPIWGLIHEQSPYKENIAYHIQKANYYSERIINLPCSTNIKSSDIEIVCQEIGKLE